MIFIMNILRDLLQRRLSTLIVNPILVQIYSNCPYPASSSSLKEKYFYSSSLAFLRRWFNKSSFVQLPRSRSVFCCNAR